MMSLGLVYEVVAFLCCRGVVVAAPVGWYPTPVPVAWGVERVVRGARLGAGCRELGRGGLRGDFVVFNGCADGVYPRGECEDTVWSGRCRDVGHGDFECA